MLFFDLNWFVLIYIVISKNIGQYHGQNRNSKKGVRMLNDTKIKSLKPKDKRYKVSDGENLYILVMPSGTKTFIYEYKSKQTLKYKRISLGKYPIMSLLEARSKRLEFQKMLLNGDEPRNSKTVTTFKEILKKWLYNLAP